MINMKAITERFIETMGNMDLIEGGSQMLETMSEDTARLRTKYDNILSKRKKIAGHVEEIRQRIDQLTRKHKTNATALTQISGDPELEKLRKRLERVVRFSARSSIRWTCSAVLARWK